jgi:hypothetical protein
MAAAKAVLEATKRTRKARGSTRQREYRQRQREGVMAVIVHLDAGALDWLCRVHALDARVLGLTDMRELRRGVGKALTEVVGSRQSSRGSRYRLGGGSVSAFRFGAAASRTSFAPRGLPATTARH